MTSLSQTANVAGKTVLVVGLGKSGLAAAKLLVKHGAKVIANDHRDTAALREKVLALGAEPRLGGHDPELFCAVDQIVVSPGVPTLPALSAAEGAGVPIAGEVELASWFIQGTIVAVTGTNGKSTVTSLIGAMAKRTGRPTFVGGNLGTPLVDVAGTEAAGPSGLVVVELSSFQLERVKQFRAHVGVLLNVTDDHLDRYDSFAHYAAAKGNLFRSQLASDHAVVPHGDELCRSLAAVGNGAVHTFGAGGTVRPHEQAIVNGSSGFSFRLDELKLRGAHNIDNACAACISARLIGIPSDAIAGALRDFGGLSHRSEWVRSLEGVDYVDDSKATNVGAAVASVRGVRDGKVVLICGGVDKGGSYDALVGALRDRARHALVIGSSTSLIQAAFSGESFATESSMSLQAAVERARSVAQPGDTVLLAPACSSFDMFSSYKERGDAFQAAVNALSGEGA